MFQERLVYLGYVTLPVGASTWSVTGLGLQFAPTTVIITPQLPANGGLALNPKLMGAPTKDGFNVDLGITTDGAGYGFGFLMF